MHRPRSVYLDRSAVEVTVLRRADRTPVPRHLGSTCIRAAVQYHALLLMVVIAAARPSVSQTYGQAQPPNEQPSTVRGTVVNAVTHAPIARALVSSTDNRYAMLTDGEGHFEFSLPKTDNNTDNRMGHGSFFSASAHQMWLVAGTAGLLALSATKPGFLDDPEERSQPATGPDGEIRIPLMPEGLIKGRVIVAEGDPAPGINVQLFSRLVQDGMPRWVQASTAHANSSGEFRFAELLPGTYKLATTEWMENDPAVTMPGGQLYGFPPVYYPGVSDFAAAGTIQLTAGQTVQADLPITRQPYYNVQIPVANSELNAGMNITVSVQGHRGSGYSLGYNAEKQRIEGLLPNGNYLVEATTFGQTPAHGTVNLAVSGAPAEGPPMSVTRGSSINVHVTEQFTSSDWNGSMSWSIDGRSFQVHGPRLYLQISAESADDFDQASATLRPPTGPNDDSLVLDLAPGRYRLRVSSARGYVAAATLGGVDLLHEALLVSPGATTPIEVTLRDDAAELDGTVTGLPPQSATAQGPFSPGFSQAPVWVYCIPLPDSPGQFQQLPVSPDGNFNALAMPPGSYRILAFRKQHPNLPYRDPEAMQPYDTMGPVIQLSSGQKTNVQVWLNSSSE